MALGAGARGDQDAVLLGLGRAASAIGLVVLQDLLVAGVGVHKEELRGGRRNNTVESGRRQSASQRAAARHGCE